MTSYQANRDEFLVRMGSYGVSVNDLRKLLRLAETKQRLAVAQCNGDYPAEGPNTVLAARCHECDTGWERSAMRKDRCPDCRVEAQIQALVGTWNDLEVATAFAQATTATEDTLRRGYLTLSVDDVAVLHAHAKGGQYAGMPRPITVTLQGDPRGWCVRLVVEGREIGVPVRGR